MQTDRAALRVGPRVVLALVAGLLISLPGCGETATPSSSNEDRSSATASADSGETEASPAREATVEPMAEAVTLTIEPTLVEGPRLRVTGRTNLPPATKLMVSVTGQGDIDFRGQAKCMVQPEQAFAAEPIGRASGLEPGEYEVNLTMPIAHVQPASVQQVIGESDEHLRGELVEDGAMGVTVRTSQSVTVPGRSAADGRESGEVEYQVIADETLHDIKRSVTVRLTGPMSEPALETLGKKLRAADPGYERTFIEYLLPGMEPGAGAWATTHFNPKLEVKILGATVEEYARLQQTDGQGQASEEVLGRWLNEQPYMTSRITIYREGDEYLKKETYQDGSSSTGRLIERASPHGRAFAEPDAQFGDTT